MSGLVQDQSAVIDFLASPATHGGGAVERIDTHAAHLFLTGELAYKLKRAVRFEYLDFSTAELRRAACDDECRLNRRTAPTLYRRVIPVTRTPRGGLALDGEGPPVDWLIEMTRFPQEALLDRLAEDGRLDPELMAPLAAAIAAFHADAEIRYDHGGHAGLAWVVEGNAAGFAEFGQHALSSGLVARVTEATRAALARHRQTLDQRRLDGQVRHCHGDLHLRNIVLLDGRPTLFDGVEFNDAIACIDVLYDLAFLVMDLWHRDLRYHANLVLNRYLRATGRTDGLALLPLLLSCRAAVRAKTSATAAALTDQGRARPAQEATAATYLALADALLDPPPATLVAIGGFSGSGKSSVAARIAAAIGPAPGAIVLRSDEFRKRALGVPPDRTLGADGYTAEISRQVYEALARAAAEILGQGHAVVVDAVHQQQGDRETIAGVAATAGVPFVGVWLDAPEPVLVRRVVSRTDDASDADAGVVRRQLSRETGAISWGRVSAADALDEVVGRVSAILRPVPGA